jgi:hypothetical protein
MPDLNRILQQEEDFLDTNGEHKHDEGVTSVGKASCIMISQDHLCVERIDRIK